MPNRFVEKWISPDCRIAEYLIQDFLYLCSKFGERYPDCWPVIGFGVGGLLWIYDHKSTKIWSKVRGKDKIDDSEKLRPEELNQQNIEALVAESNLKMEILPVNDLDIALHDFVSKDDKMAFYSCLQHNLQATRNKLNSEADSLKFEEEELILKVTESMQERVKQRSLHSKEDMRITSNSQNPLGDISRSMTAPSSTNSFSDEEDTGKMLSHSKTVGRGRKGSSDVPKPTQAGVSKRGRGRGSSSLKQMTLQATLRTRHSERSASGSASTAVNPIPDEDVDSPSSEETEKYEVNEVVESSESEENFQGKSRKRAASRGRGRGDSSTSKRGRKLDMSSIHSMFLNKDNDDDDDKSKKVKARVCNAMQITLFSNWIFNRHVF